MCCENYFVTKLRTEGLRLTPQRELVLAVMHDIAGHATAEEIFEQVHARSAAVDISTVYRTLELLQDFNLVAIVDLGDGQYRYELLSLHGPHHHLHCRVCGRLVRIEADAVEPLRAHLAASAGFAADLEHLVIPGVCAECRAAGTSLEERPDITCTN
jgi:Fur family ferric uptake transcriptional regulator